MLLSIHLEIAISLWAGTVISSFCHKTKSSLSNFLPQGTLNLLMPVLIIIETIRLLIQPIVLAIRLLANITAGHVFIYLIGGAVLALISSSLHEICYSSSTHFTWICSVICSIIRDYVLTLLVSLYFRNDPPDPCILYSKSQPPTSYRSLFSSSHNS